MIGKTKIVFSLILASLFLIIGFGMVSATTCTPQSYDSGWLDIKNYVTSFSGDAALYNGDYYIDSGTGIVNMDTTSLPFSGTYTFYVKYGIGTGNDINTEDFQVVCGGQTHTFLDSVLEDNPQVVIDSMSCTFNSGSNPVQFKSINTGSVHLYKFKIIGSKTCPPQPTCGDGTVNQASEQCDLGILNGQVCNPLYGQTCTWCNSQCQEVTEQGEYCGDGICQANEGEDCNTCSQDCGACPPQPTCGDGTVNQASEQCDLGILNGQVCNPLYGQTCTWCNSQCQEVTEQGEYCGDGIRQGNEECDDGNNINGDGCSSTCKKENGDKRKKSPVVLEVCNPDWKCSGWSECIGGVMTRNCVDDNFCEIEYNKPHEVTACDITEQVKEPANNNLFWFIIGVIILIILLIILVNLLR